MCSLGAALQALEREGWQAAIKLLKGLGRAAEGLKTNGSETCTCQGLWETRPRPNALSRYPATVEKGQHVRAPLPSQSCGCGIFYPKTNSTFTSGLAQPPEIFPHSAFGHFGPAPFPRAVLFPLGGEASACLPLHEQPVRI